MKTRFFSKHSQSQNQKEQVGFCRLALFLLLLCCTASGADKRRPAAEKALEPAESSSSSSKFSHGQHIVGFNLGQTVLFGEWGTIYEDGISFNAYYDYEASPVFGFLFKAGLSRHSGASNNKLSIVNLEPDLKINFVYFDSLILYGFAGFGIYPVSQAVAAASGSTLNFGMNVGFGLDLRITEHISFGPGIELKSVFAKTDQGAKSGSYPDGLNIGGEFLRMYIQAGYVF